MEIFNEISPLKAFLDGQRSRGNSIGLVPTMGALHTGHIALIEASRKQNKLTVCSIYVNPAQFNNTEDLRHYPRMFDQDKALLENAGCDVLFMPGDGVMYPEPSVLKFSFGELEQVMEGTYRPGHFSGVGLAVSKLLNIVEPTRAYFGQKDWQQFAIIQKLVRELKFNVELQCVPTLRESDGLAMSSRNMRLTPEQRKKADIFYKALSQAREALIKGTEIGVIKKRVHQSFEKTDVRLEYFEITDSQNLVVLNSVKDPKQTILCIAGYIGSVRLIDNMFLDL